MKTYIGIDPGLSGGVSSLLPSGEQRSNVMPIKPFGRRNTVDVDELLKLFPGGRSIVIIEAAQKFSAGTNALTSTWFGYGRITGALEIMGIPFEVIASPRTWQKEFWTKPKLPKGEKFDTKAASVSAAQRLFPDMDFLPTPRCKRPSDGMTDAILIAEYGRRRNL